MEPIHFASEIVTPIYSNPAPSTFSTQQQNEIQNHYQTKLVKVSGSAMNDLNSKTTPKALLDQAGELAGIQVSQHNLRYNLDEGLQPEELQALQPIELQ